MVSILLSLTEKLLPIESDYFSSSFHQVTSNYSFLLLMLLLAHVFLLIVFPAGNSSSFPLSNFHMATTQLSYPSSGESSAHLDYILPLCAPLTPISLPLLCSVLQRWVNS